MIFIEACNLHHRAAGGWLKKHNYGEFGCFGEALPTRAEKLMKETNFIKKQWKRDMVQVVWIIMIQIKSILKVVNVPLFIKKNKYWLGLIISGFVSCNVKDPEIIKNDMLINALYQTECFSHKQALKDSAQNIKQFLEPQKVILDSTNNVQLEYFYQTIQSCVNDRVILINSENKYYLIPWCMSKYCNAQDTSLFQEKNEIIVKMKEMFKNVAFKDKNKIMKIIFEDILLSYPFDNKSFKMIDFANSQDSLQVSAYLKEKDRVNYRSRDCSNTIWSYKFNGDSIDIALINLKKGVCYSL